jgi:hypothetical protein
MRNSRKQCSAGSLDTRASTKRSASQETPDGIREAIHGRMPDQSGWASSFKTHHGARRTMPVIRVTKPLERLDCEIKRRTDVGGIIPDPAALDVTALR